MPLYLAPSFGRGHPRSPEGHVKLVYMCYCFIICTKMNRTYTNRYVLASKMLKTTKLLFISLCFLCPLWPDYLLKKAKL